MKKAAQQGKTGAAAKPVKTQKTLLHFFQLQAQTSSVSEKVTCPGCSLQIPERKINWHLDQECKSKSHQKKGGKSFKSLKNRKHLKAIKDKGLKTRKRAVLSDSEDETEDITVLDVKETKKPGSNDSDSYGLYISPSMIETQILETDVYCGIKDECCVPSQKDLDSHTLSPYFSPGCKDVKSTPIKRHEKVIECALPKISQNLAVLVSDWDSPQATPEKDPEHLKVNASKLLPSYRSTCSPQTKSGWEVKTILEKDWDCNSPVATPKKESVENKKINNILSPGITLRTNSESEDDFQKSPTMSQPKILTPRKRMNSVSSVLTKQKKSSLSSHGEADLKEDSDYFEETTRVMRTPKKATPKKSVKSVSPKSPKERLKSVSPKSMDQKPSKESPGKEHERDLDDFEKTTFVCETPNKHSSVKKLKSSSPCYVRSMKQSDLEEMKNVSIFSETKSLDQQESVINILRSPEASGDSNVPDSDTESLTFFEPIGSLENLVPCRSPSPTPSNSDTESHNHVRQLFTASPSKSNLHISPESSESKVKVNVSSEVRINVKKFTNAAKTLENENEIFNSLLHSSMQKVTNSNRSPWKFKQGLKKTGLLQNSSQNFSAAMSFRKKQTTPSPLGSVSNSPAKSDTGEQSPSNNTEKKDQQKYDSAIYRQYKGYYLENFLRILDTVLSQPQDLRLLNEDDLEVIKTFQGLSLSAQKLYVRLFQRKIKWNRVSKIEYRDICDHDDTELYVNELGYANFLHQESEMDDLEEVLQLLSCGELQGFCKQMRISATGKKEDVVAALLKFSKQQTTITAAFSKQSSGKSVLLKKARVLMGRCCRVNKNVRQVFMRLFMLYGLPRYDEEEEGGQPSPLTTLLMVNMGKMKFPHFDIIRNHSIFRFRDDLIRFETCSQILTDVQECMDSKKWDIALKHCEMAKTVYQNLLKDKDLLDHDKSLPSFLRHFTSVSLLVYILTCSVECYQRIKSYQKAVNQLQELLDQDIYLQDYRGRWYDRLALNLEMHLKKPALAVEVIGKALNDPEVRKGHRLSLSLRAERMAASPRFKDFAPIITEMPLMNPKEAPKVIIEGRTIHADIPGYKRLFIRQDSDRHAGEGEVTVCSVEELALRHYKELGYFEGLHREGTTVNTLFALYFWDALYAPVSDVFRSPHQATPLDLDDANFYMARKEQIDNRLSELQNWSEAAAEAELERVWNDHSGELSLVSWDLFRSLDHAKGLVISMGLPVLAAICERLAKDHRFTRSGFPDLIVWDPSNKRCCIVEVKGPNDRLSTKQILWLDYLLTNGATAEVCHVEAIGAKKMKRASPRKISPKKDSPKKVSSKKSIDDKAADLEEVLKTKRKQIRKKKKTPENDELMTVKKCRGKKSNNFKEKRKKIIDNDSSEEKRLTSRKTICDYDEQRKEITENDSIMVVKQSKRKNSEGKEKRKKMKRNYHSVTEISRRKNSDDDDDFEEYIE